MHTAVTLVYSARFSVTILAVTSPEADASRWCKEYERIDPNTHLFPVLGTLQALLHGLVVSLGFRVVKAGLPLGGQRHP